MWIEMCSVKDWTHISTILEACAGHRAEQAKLGMALEEGSVMAHLWFINDSVTSTWGLQSHPEQQMPLLALGGKKGIRFGYKRVSVSMTAIKGESHSSKDHTKNLGSPHVRIQAATSHEQ